MAQVGDKVWYVPSEEHCYDTDKDGKYAADFQVRNPRSGEVKDADDAEVKKVLHDAARRQQTDVKGKLILFKKFKYFWPATIEFLHGDGTADLAIQYIRPEYTHHYSKVPHDTNKTQFHSWHAQAQEMTFTTEHATGDDE